MYLVCGVNIHRWTPSDCWFQIQLVPTLLDTVDSLFPVTMKLMPNDVGKSL